MQPTQTKTFTRAELNIRPARPEDRATLEAIAAQIWDGGDYLPRILDKWFSDPYDGFFVATVQDRVAGVAKLTRWAEGEWWLEGLRVDPEYQGQGLSRILHHFMLNQLRQLGSGTVRFSTSGDNDAVRTLAKETGFEQVAEFRLYVAGALDEPVQMLRPLGPTDAARVWAWLEASAHYARAQKSLEKDWTWLWLSEERLAERLAAGLVYAWDDIAGVVILNTTADLRWPDEDALPIAYVDATNLPEAAWDLRRLAASLDRQQVYVKVLDRADDRAAFEQAGYELEWDFSAVLYARDVSLTLNAEVRVNEIPGD